MLFGSVGVINTSQVGILGPLCGTNPRSATGSNKAVLVPSYRVYDELEVLQVLIKMDQGLSAISQHTSASRGTFQVNIPFHLTPVSFKRENTMTFFFPIFLLQNAR